MQGLTEHYPDLRGALHDEDKKTGNDYQPLSRENNIEDMKKEIMSKIEDVIQRETKKSLSSERKDRKERHIDSETENAKKSLLMLQRSFEEKEKLEVESQAALKEKVKLLKVQLENSSERCEILEKKLKEKSAVSSNVIDFYLNLFLY